MSLLVTTDLQKPRSLLFICDFLKQDGLDGKIPVNIQVGEEDLELHQSQLVFATNKPTPEPGTKKTQREYQEQDNESLQSEADCVQSSRGSGSDKSSDLDFESDSESNNNLKLDQQQSMTYKVQLGYPNRTIFLIAYAKDLKAMETAYNCNFTISSKEFQIRCQKNSPIIELKKDLYRKSSQIHIKQISKRSYLVNRSALVESKLKAKNAFINMVNNHVYVWTIDKWMNAKQLQELIVALIVSKCIKKVVVFQDQRKQDMHLYKKFFSVLMLCVQKRMHKLESLYDVIVEPINKYAEIIVHLDSQEFYDQVKDKIYSLFERNLLFSFEVKLEDIKRIQLQNLFYRTYKNLTMKIFGHSVMICINASNIEKTLVSVLKDIVSFDLLGKGTSMTICFSHFKERTMIQRLLNLSLPKSIICEQKGGICLYKTKIQGSQIQDFPLILQKIGRFILGDFCGLQQQTNEFCQTSMEDNSLDTSNGSLSCPDGITQSIDQSTCEDYFVQLKIYSHTLQESESSKVFDVEKQFPQRNEVEKFIEKELGWKYNVNCINVSKKWFGDLDLNQMKIYGCAEEIVEANEPKKELNLVKLTRHHEEELRYLVQVSKAYYGGKGLTCQLGYYIPVYQLTK